MIFDEEGHCVPSFNISDEDRALIVKAVEAARNQPKLVNGIWWIWDFDKRKYISTGQVGSTQAQSVGGLTNVSDMADEVATEDLILMKKAGSSVWTPMPLNDSNGASSLEGDKNYYHSQGTAAEEWVIEHNLGKFPAVTVVSSAGEQIYCDVRFDSINKVTLSFGSPLSGAAFLN